MKKPRPLHLLCLLVALAALALLAACRAEQPPPLNAPVKVGALFPMSGDLADKGADSAHGVTLAVEEINARGGVAALGGAKLELVLADTQGKPEEGARQTERLIQKEGVAALVGTYQSSVTKTATQVAERLETPFIVSISIADVITERGFQYTFRIQPQARFYARDQVLFLKDLEAATGLSLRRVALLHENTDFGTSTALSQKEALRQHGMELAAEVSYQAEGVEDLEREVAQVLAAQPQAILTVTYLKDAILIRQALAASGWQGILLDTAGGTVSPEYAQALGPLAEGTLTLAEFSKFAPGGRQLNDRFRARFNHDITGDSAHAYQAVLALWQALEKAGSSRRQPLRSAIAQLDLGPGPWMVLPAGRLRFDAAGQNQHASLYVVQMSGGEFVPVWPPERATARVQLPQ